MQKWTYSHELNFWNIVKYSDTYLVSNKNFQARAEKVHPLDCPLILLGAPATPIQRLTRLLGGLMTPYKRSKADEVSF